MERRLRQHNGFLKGGARSTRSDKDWVVEELRGPYPDQSSALKVEYAWKQAR
jgi:structure-specific endonuclease subunit SLX1